MTCTTEATFRIIGENVHATRIVRLPVRRLINDVFLVLAIEAGADSGIIDPVASSVEQALALDRESRSFRLAHDVLTRADRHCRAYMKAYRAGELELPEIGIAR